MSNIRKEYEKRVMITESDYFKIVSHFMRLNPDRKYIKNTNIYFDTPDLYMRHHHSNLRIRIIDDEKYELTLKISRPEGDDELNDYPTKKEVDALLKHGAFPDGVVKRFLLTLPYPLADYRKITTLETIRLEIENEDHLLVIDKNTYSNIVDYNIEIEAEDSINVANKRLNDYMKQFNIVEPAQKYIGKSHRAIDATLKRN